MEPNALSERAVCDSKKSRFTKEQEASWLLLNKLELKTPSSKIPLFGDILF